MVGWVPVTTQGRVKGFLSVGPVGSLMVALLLLSWLLPPVPLEEAPRTFSPNYACPP